LTGFFPFEAGVLFGWMKIWDTVANGRRGREDGNDEFRLGVVLFVVTPDCEASGEEIEGLGLQVGCLVVNAVIVTVAIFANGEDECDGGKRDDGGRRER